MNRKGTAIGGGCALPADATAAAAATAFATASATRKLSARAAAVPRWRGGVVGIRYGLSGGALPLSLLPVLLPLA